ncbi:mitochondrial small ribosomal subunit protein uS17m [bacterium]|jgi:small subunit ribosomal protein S17|nr:mitochondrial small ribosomal subunit protein uS17m [bacterium]MBT6831524.1 mitochondrial small ribosomal subunit protein uS17m [bacterium]MBT6996175.1 mitochondrial small ribosomal subunit protein uS17m [bacterium]MBT7772557.1 mitochondrial small ribosomal subunit protein uS17m [bacterium]
MITKKGTVTKISGTKTVKVEVVEKRPHPKYKKMYRITKNFLTHDEKNVATVGDSVVIHQCRPVSKNKHWEIETVVTAVTAADKK